MRDILVVEDHPLVAEATKSLLSTLDVDHIEICETAERAMARLRERADWFRIFLDVGVPGANGLSLIRYVYGRGFSSRSAVITASEHSEWREEVRALGFLGYILKTASVDDFSLALQNILDGKSNFAIQKSDKLSLHLTRRQTEILDMLRDGMAPQEIGWILKLPVSAVNNQIGALLHALRAGTTEQAVSIGIRLGYISAKFVE